MAALGLPVTKETAAAAAVPQQDTSMLRSRAKVSCDVLNSFYFAYGTVLTFWEMDCGFRLLFFKRKEIDAPGLSRWERDGRTERWVRSALRVADAL